MARLLLARGADLNHVCGNDCPLFCALENQYPNTNMMAAWDEGMAADGEDWAPAVLAVTFRDDMTRLLLMHGADPNVKRWEEHSGPPHDPHAPNRVAGATPAMSAVTNGELVCLQLLAIFGGDMSAKNDEGRSVQEHNELGGFGTLVWLKAVEGWPAFKIAVAHGDVATAKAALALGRISPRSCTLDDVIAAASAAAGQHWEGSPASTPAMLQLARDGMAPWAPARHFLFHAGFRGRIHTLLLVAAKLRERHAFATTISPSNLRLLGKQTTVVGLPDELWCLICGFMLREDWPIPAPALPVGTSKQQ